MSVGRITTLNVIHERDLEHREERDFAYEGPSWGGGDQALVLVWPEQLIEELKEKGAHKYQRLIDEMRALPPGTYIALEG